MIFSRQSSLLALSLWLLRFSMLLSRGRCAFSAARSSSSSSRRSLSFLVVPNQHTVASVSSSTITSRVYPSATTPALFLGRPTTTTTSSRLLASSTVDASAADGTSNAYSSKEEEDDSKKNTNTNNDPSQDTIFALSSGYTGQQATALAVLRLSGPHAHDVLQSMIKTKLPPARQAALRKLYFNGVMLDHALVLKFDGPHSFTGEDLVELHCHGSRAVVQGMLDVLPVIHGGCCRMAEPGEFTQRAFGNGKLDLVQVEALADILTADTQAQLQQALSQLDGKTSQVYDDWRSQLISGLAHAEAVIDFGDDERLGEDDILDDDSAQWNVWGNVHARMQALRTSMEGHLRDERKGELVREGVKIAIVGPPNAGKSSLFNVLARKDAAIVSPIAGTTRDVLQVSMDLGGVKCTLQDTAGVRSETTDTLELEGIKRAQSVAEQADLVVAMVDATETSTGMDIIQEVLEVLEENSKEKLRSEHIMLVLNKLDLVTANANTAATTTATATSNSNDLTMATSTTGLAFGGGTHQISCVTQQGIDAFLDALTKSVVTRTTQGGEHNGAEGTLITRARHRQHVEAAAEALERFENLSLQGTMAVDMAAEELRLAASELGRITGAVDVEDVLDVLFTDFCIGK
jgi:tRNA modification GTPase